MVVTAFFVYVSHFMRFAFWVNGRSHSQSIILYSVQRLHNPFARKIKYFAGGWPLITITLAGELP